MANKIYITNHQSQADYKVYFVSSESQERNAQIIKGCKLTDYQSQADIKITRKNFPTT